MQKSKLAFFAAVFVSAIAGLASSGIASASTYDLGQINGTQSFANGAYYGPGGSVIHGPNTTLVGSFSDSVTFSISGTSNGNYGANAFSLFWGPLELSGISNFAISLFSANNPNVALASGVSGSFSNLSAGSYFLSVTGTGTGLFGGGYGGSLTAVPVPEPGEWALILSGLGLIGYIARRRSAAKA